MQKPTTQCGSILIWALCVTTIACHRAETAAEAVTPSASEPESKKVLQSPFVINANGRYWMYYGGGYAAEIVVDGEKQYVSSNKDVWGGVRLHHLKWVE